MESLLISACLLGRDCKYSGGNNALPPELLCRLREKYRLIAVCPETAGGLPTPRESSERLGDRVVSKSGRDVTANYSKGAETALWAAKRYGCVKALMKEKSPSCGSGLIFDGSFTKTLISGDGMAAEKLKKAGVSVYGESRAEELI